MRASWTKNVIEEKELDFEDRAEIIEQQMEEMARRASDAGQPTANHSITVGTMNESISIDRTTDGESNFIFAKRSRHAGTNPNTSI